MDKNFEKALDFVMKSEGGYSNHIADKGGATNYGITQGTYNAYRKRIMQPFADVKNITKEEAVKIYYDEYWLKSGACNIDDEALAVCYFDACVNHGINGAKNLLNQANNNTKVFLELRRERYKKIAAKNSSQRVFLHGWLNRIHNLEVYIKSFNIN